MSNNREPLHAFAEAMLVLFFAFLYPVWSSLQHIFASTSAAFAFSDSAMFALTIFEVSGLGMFALYWRARGHTLSNLGLDVARVDIPYGLLLLVTVFILAIVQYQVWLRIARSVPTTGVFGLKGHLSIAPLLAGSLINAVFEEVLVVGFVFSTLSEMANPVLLIVLSALLRASYHTYQGWYGVVFVTLLGFTFGLFYWRFRRLTPLVATHAVLDIYAFAHLIRT
jgi:uncharacterized protein